MAKMAELADKIRMDDEDGMTLFAVHAHYPNGGSELWDTATTLKQAEKKARGVMFKHRLAKLEDGSIDPEGGGVQWVEVFGPGIEESLGFERVGTKVVQTG